MEKSNESHKKLLSPLGPWFNSNNPQPPTQLRHSVYRCREPYVIFSGGMPYDKASRTPSLTVMHAKNTTVLEMEHNVVDFLTLCSTPWNNGKSTFQFDPDTFFSVLLSPAD